MRLTLTAAALAAVACLTPSAGAARGAAARSGPYRLDVVDESGRPLPAYEHRARSYVLGTLGQRYLLRFRNDGTRRVEVVASVDGRDVVDGRPARWQKRGYLVEPGGEVTIDGFRLSSQAVAAFRFSSVPRSYAALQGDARDVGVIGIAVFSERERPVAAYPPPLQQELRAREAPEPPRDAAVPAPQRADSTVARRGQAGEAAERPGLGTEFGERRESHVRIVSFERASSRPDAVLTVRYDDREGLIAAGIDVDRHRWADGGDAWMRETAEPFRRDGAFAEPPRGWRPTR